jgi:hypothetical protein
LLVADIERCAHGGTYDQIQRGSGRPEPSVCLAQEATFLGSDQHFGGLLAWVYGF